MKKIEIPEKENLFLLLSIKSFQKFIIKFYFDVVLKIQQIQQY